MQPLESSNIAVIRNGKHQRKQLLNSWAKENSGKYRIRIYDTRHQGHATELAKDVIESGATHVIAVGGDGTLNEVINGILESSQPATPLLYYPGGTANDWSKTMPAPANTYEILPRLGGNPAPVNLGKIRYNEHGTTLERFFVNIADLGMGADVVKIVNENSKWMGPNLTFMKAILQTFLKYRNKQASIELDGKVLRQKIRALIIANGKYFGSGMCIAPEANPWDDSFQVVIIGDVNIIDYLRYLPLIKRGKRILHPGVNYYNARKIQVSSEENICIEADGEFLGTVPVTVDSGSYTIELL